MKTTRLAAAVLAATVATAVPAQAAPTGGQWEQFGRDGAKTHYQLSTGGLHAGSVTGLREKWRRTGELPGGAAYTGGRLYLADTTTDYTGRIRRLNPATGQVEATVARIRNRAFEGLAVAGGTLLVQSVDNQRTRVFVTAFSLGGSPKWEVALPVGEYNASHFTVSGTTVVIATGAICWPQCQTWTLRAFDTATGAAKWATPLGGYGADTSSVVLGSAVMHAITRPNNGGQAVAAFALDTGAPLWTAAATSTPAGWGGAVFTSGAGTVCSLNAGSGTRRWCHDDQAIFYGDLAFGPEAVYLPDQDGRLLRLRPSDGQVVWTTTLGGRIATPLASGGGTAYAYVRYSGRNEIVAVRATDGMVLKRVTISTTVRPFVDQLILAEGRLILIGTSVVALGL